MRAAILLSLLLFASASRSLAAPVLRVEHDLVRAGSEVELRWDTDEPAVEEVEIELSLPGAGWRRISPELEAHAGRFVWRVPSGLAGPVRLRLRFGDRHGESVGEEIVVQVSAERVPHAAAARAGIELPEGTTAGCALNPNAPALRTLATLPAAHAPRHDEAAVRQNKPQGVAPLARAGNAAAAPASRRFEPPRRAPLRN